MALTRRVWSLGKLLLLAGALVVTYVVFFGIAMRVAVRTREVLVPTLAGRTVNDAHDALSALGLTLKVEEARRPDPKVQAGRVVAQDPAQGLPTRTQRNVRVWLSDGPASTQVPALVGESERTAQIRMQMASLRVSSIAEIHSATYASGVVVAQSPPPATRASSVSLMVNRGGSGVSYVMPDVIGVAADRAAALLRDQGFRVTVVGAQPYPGIAPGLVIRQTPQPGFQVAPGEPIGLEVSR
jgi:serine/threonine-protein kinase